MAKYTSGQSEDPDLDRLDDLGRKIEAARGSEPKPRTQQPSGRLNVVYRLSTEFVASVFVGIAIGWGFDVVTGLKPVGIILFSMLGIGAAFYSVFRVMRELNGEQNKEGS